MAIKKCILFSEIKVNFKFQISSKINYINVEHAVPHN